MKLVIDLAPTRRCARALVLLRQRRQHLSAAGGLGILGAPLFLLVSAAFHPGAKIGVWICAAIAVVGYGVVLVSKKQ